MNTAWKGSRNLSSEPVQVFLLSTAKHHTRTPEDHDTVHRWTRGWLSRNVQRTRTQSMKRSSAGPPTPFRHHEPFLARIICSRSAAFGIRSLPQRTINNEARGVPGIWVISPALRSASIRATREVSAKHVSNAFRSRTPARRASSRKGTRPSESCALYSVTYIFSNAD